MPESAEIGSAWVEVYSTRTGLKQDVPAEWMDHPVLSAGLRKTPLSEKQQRAADALLASVHPTDDPA